jgi:hypothetical protein
MVVLLQIFDCPENYMCIYLFLNQDERELSFDLPLRYYEVTLYHFLNSQVYSVQVRQIPRGYLSVARQVEKHVVMLKKKQSSLSWRGGKDDDDVVKEELVMMTSSEEMGRTWLASDLEVMAYLKRVSPTLITALYRFQVIIIIIIIIVYEHVYICLCVWFFFGERFTCFFPLLIISLRISF